MSCRAFRRRRVLCARRSVRLVAGASAVCLLGACSPYQTYHAYAGPKLPRAQLGVLEVMTQGDCVTWVDGIEVRQLLCANPDTRPRVLLKPGTHEITVRYSASSRIGPWGTNTRSAGPVTLRFTCVAGQASLLGADVGTSGWKPYIR